MKKTAPFGAVGGGLIRKIGNSQNPLLARIRNENTNSPEMHLGAHQKKLFGGGVKRQAPRFETQAFTLREPSIALRAIFTGGVEKHK